MGAFIAGLIAAVLFAAAAIFIYDAAHVPVATESPDTAHVSRTDPGPSPQLR
jgi:hypothetical protein